ncbi:MAG: T9SS type A sorting domain-containing protein, partial [Chitinophagaceae bacterium]|nr:T9SS type A sorting domain-containing protein [Chitinophagaceae bacterium]
NFIVINKVGNNNNLPHQIQLTDMAGRVLINTKLETINSQIILPIQQIPAGTYVVRITVANETFIQKIVKNN